MRARITPDQKVFGVGLSKTGTTSLNDALNLLGIRSIHFPHDPQTFEELARGEYRLSVLNEYQGATDTPVAPFFAQLDKAWPGSKFILTVRDRDSWLRSAEAHWRGLMVGRRLKDPQFGAYVDFISAAVYGCIYFNAERFRYAYEVHERLVREYFSNRPDDLLVLDIFRGEGMPELCEFLGLPLPEDSRFPHVNRGDKWPRMVAASREELGRLVPAGQTVVVIDEEVIGEDLTDGRRRLPFLERDGEYWGNPPDDATAIRELARLREEAGADYLVVAWPSFWWLEHYREFDSYLRSRHRCVLSNDRLVVFDLKEDVSARD
jgi:hypothetical protein